MSDDMVTMFIHALFEDVLTAQARWHKNNTQAIRRNLVRTIFTAIEGLNWQLRQDLLTTHGKHPAVGHHEVAALLGESYRVNDSGKIAPQLRYIPLAASIRLVVHIMGRIRPGYGLDFGHVGWSLLMKSIDVRNRIAHPKTFDDLHVSDDEATDSWRAFLWFLTYVIRVMREQNADLETVSQKLKHHLPPTT